jgi:hypothetical protein
MRQALKHRVLQGGSATSAGEAKWTVVKKPASRYTGA